MAACYARPSLGELRLEIFIPISAAKTFLSMKMSSFKSRRERLMPFFTESSASFELVRFCFELVALGYLTGSLRKCVGLLPSVLWLVMAWLRVALF